jgi:hypothetical protein
MGVWRSTRDGEGVDLVSNSLLQDVAIERESIAAPSAASPPLGCLHDEDLGQPSSVDDGVDGVAAFHQHPHACERGVLIGGSNHAVAASHRTVRQAAQFVRMRAGRVSDLLRPRVSELHLARAAAAPDQLDEVTSIHVASDVSRLLTMNCRLRT